MDERLIGLRLLGGEAAELRQQTRRDANGDELLGSTGLRSSRGSSRGPARAAAGGAGATRRARFNSSGVDSGMSEKSMRLSGIGSALLAARLAGADNADRFRAIFRPPQSVDQNEYSTAKGAAQPLLAALRFGMHGVFPLQSVRIGEHGRRFFKRDAVLVQIGKGFARIPSKHIYVYTLTQRSRQPQTARVR